MKHILNGSTYMVEERLCWQILNYWLLYVHSMTYNHVCICMTKSWVPAPSQEGAAGLADCHLEVGGVALPTY